MRTISFVFIILFFFSILVPAKSNCSRRQRISWDKNLKRNRIHTELRCIKQSNIQKNDRMEDEKFHIVSADELTRIGEVEKHNETATNQFKIKKRSHPLDLSLPVNKTYETIPIPKYSNSDSNKPNVTNVIGSLFEQDTRRSNIQWNNSFSDRANSSR
jgi:hypothetical protein